MEYSESRGIKTQRWEANQLLRNDDINRMGELSYATYTDLLATLARQRSTAEVISGTQLEASTALTCIMRAGAAVAFDGPYLTASGVWGFSANPGFPFSVVVPAGTNVAFDTGVGQTNPRIDTLEIRPTRVAYNPKSRVFKDPITGSTSSSLTNTSEEYGFEFKILKGTEAASPAAPASTAGWIKIAEVRISNGATEIFQSDIIDYRDSDLWTTAIRSTVSTDSDRLFHAPRSPLKAGGRNIISEARTALALPPNAEVGSSVDLTILPDTAGVRITQLADQMILRDYATTTIPGVDGYFNTRPGQRLELTKIGNAGKYKIPAVKVADPAIIPDRNTWGCDWSNNGRYHAIGSTTGGTLPLLHIYDWSSGSPVRIADPAILPTNEVTDIKWSPDDRYMAVTNTGGGPHNLTIYDFSSGVPVKIADPADMPAGAFHCGWSPDGRYLTVATSLTSPFYIYDFSSGVPVKIADPADMPSGTGGGVAWSPDGRYMAIGHSTTPFITIYDWSSGVPVKIADPATLPATSTIGCSWSSNGKYLAWGHSVAPFMGMYDWSSGAPILMGLPAVPPTGNVRRTAFTKDSHYLLLAHGAAPVPLYYDMSLGVPVKVTEPAGLPTGVGTSVGSSPDGRYLLWGHNNSPYFHVYDTLEFVSDSWLLRSIDGPTPNKHDFDNATP